LRRASIALARRSAPDAVIRGVGHPVCGGRGSPSRQTPHELVAAGDRIGIDGAALATASQLVAKVEGLAAATVGQDRGA
jgi:hypothetical protein